MARSTAKPPPELRALAEKADGDGAGGALALDRGRRARGKFLEPGRKAADLVAERGERGLGRSDSRLERAEHDNVAVAAAGDRHGVFEVLDAAPVGVLELLQRHHLLRQGGKPRRRRLERGEASLEARHLLGDRLGLPHGVGGGEVGPGRDDAAGVVDDAEDGGERPAEDAGRDQPAGARPVGLRPLGARRKRRDRPDRRLRRRICRLGAGRLGRPGTGGLGHGRTFRSRGLAASAGAASGTGAAEADGRRIGNRDRL